MPQSRKYSDPDVIAQIADLTLRSRRLVEGAISGMHRSPFHGFNIEFAEYREYTPAMTSVGSIGASSPGPIATTSSNMKKKATSASRFWSMPARR